MEGNLSLLLYYRSTVGRHNTSSKGSVSPEPEPELLPSSSPPRSIAASPEIGGSPLLVRVFLRFLTDLHEEEAIIGEQGREKEEKEKEKEEKKLGFVLSECAF